VSRKSCATSHSCFLRALLAPDVALFARHGPFSEAGQCAVFLRETVLDVLAEVKEPATLDMPRILSTSVASGPAQVVFDYSRLFSGTLTHQSASLCPPSLILSSLSDNYFWF